MAYNRAPTPLEKFYESNSDGSSDDDAPAPPASVGPTRDETRAASQPTGVATGVAAFVALSAACHADVAHCGGEPNEDTLSAGVAHDVAGFLDREDAHSGACRHSPGSHCECDDDEPTSGECTAERGDSMAERGNERGCVTSRSDDPPCTRESMSQCEVCVRSRVWDNGLVRPFRCLRNQTEAPRLDLHAHKHGKLVSMHRRWVGGRGGGAFSQRTS